MEKQLLIIGGPTGVGKTGLGVWLAKRFKAELVSADSRQVYQGMDIGTGKDLPVGAEFEPRDLALAGQPLGLAGQSLNLGVYYFNSVPVWGLDLVKPSVRFSVADWLLVSRKVIRDIWSRQRLAVVVGGTGFWLKALLMPPETLGIAPDWQLREHLKGLTVDQLRLVLAKVDSQRLQEMNRSDQSNPRRLIRAIEVGLNQLASGQSGSSQLKKSLAGDRLAVDKLLAVGLKAELVFIDQRIKERLKERLDQGLEREVKELIDQGYRFDNSVLGETIGYQEWSAYFNRQQSKKAVIQLWQSDEGAYARRQLTWFNKFFREIESGGWKTGWFRVDQPGWRARVAKVVKNWYDDS